MSLASTPNRLINEKSPYLLQHANNPVDWYPWCEEAFQRAKNENKPIFLSIGYSTCHWCHVMEKESFEDFEVSELLNEFFIPIKVDREERPDIDTIYMSVCQAMTGSGGWPLTIVMTSDKKPFFAGTYFPKKSKQGYAGLIDILNKIHEVWQENRTILLEASDNIIRDLKRYSINEQGKINEGIIKETYETLKKSFDSTFGGFSGSPKFPTPHNINFLLKYWKLSGEEKALEMVKISLNAMYKGGIFDHIGFGFSRYSVDNKWLVPHFEKMLYDNALLSYAYLEAYHATGENLYKEIAEKIFNYVLRDMTSSEGGFYSAEDADSEGKEGKFYLWSKGEIENLLEKEESELFCKCYDISLNGNFEGKSIPNLIKTNLEVLEDQKIKDKLEKIREKLFAYREKRIHPHKDDKILTSWNGLMIASMAYGGRILNNSKYIEAAKKALNFIFNKLKDENGRLLARYRDGEAAYPAYLDDYAFIILALIEMYETTYEYAYLKKALQLNDEMIKYFWDDENRGLFIYAKDSEQLVLKSKEVYDGAIPSGNSVAAMNMIRLYKITGDIRLEQKCNEIFGAFGGTIESFPKAYTKMITAFLYSIVPGKQIVIAGRRKDKETEKFLRIVKERYMPFTTTVFNDGNNDIIESMPFISNQGMIENKTAVYVCENYTCGLPITSIDDFIKRI